MTDAALYMLVFCKVCNILTIRMLSSLPLRLVRWSPVQLRPDLPHQQALTPFQLIQH